MKLNYTQKFKDRNPQDTIALISQFFTSKDCEIRVEIQQESSTTWSAQLELYYEQNKIAIANGKGTTKDFCLASAHAELYERFCNKIFFISNYHINKRMMNMSYENYTYYYSPNEKVLTFEEAFNTVTGQEFLSHMGYPNLKVVIDELFDNRYIGVPFVSTNNKSTIYLDPRISLYLNNSSGMAAGNSFYEAFNQGMSEIYEHYVTNHVYNDKLDQYYSLDLTQIKNLELQNIIAQIQQDNDLYILDLSYNYQMPVLMSVLVNKRTHSITTNLGSFPIFEIALERILTELYQGTYSFNDTKYHGQIPMAQYPNMTAAEAFWPGCTMKRTVFPEHIISKMSEIQQFNSSIFITGDHSNKELYNYILHLNTINNLDVYYFNCSLIPDMYAIKVFVANLPYLQQDFKYTNDIGDTTNHLLFLLKLHRFLKNYVDNNEFNINSLIHLVEENHYYINTIDNFYLNNLLWLRNQFSISIGYVNTQNVLELIEKLLFDQEYLLDYRSEMHPFYANTSENIYKQLVLYTILIRYLSYINYYNSEEILNICKFLNITVSQDDLIAIANNNIEYWIQKIIFSDLNHIRNGNYDSLIKMLASCNWSN